MDDKLKEYEEALEESKQMVKRWAIEREEMMDQNLRLDQLSKERMGEIEKLTYTNGKLCIKMTLMMIELERAFIKANGDVGTLEKADDQPRKSQRRSQRASRR